MSSRERWILYPLLFLTLGITMRDKVIPPRLTAEEITVDKIRCNYLGAGHAECQRIDALQMDCRILAVVGGTGDNAARLGTASGGGGLLELFGRDGKSPVVLVGADETGQSGMVETLNRAGVPLTQLRSNKAGGVVTAASRDAKTWVVMGHTCNDYGVFAESTVLGRRMPLTLPWRFESEPDEAKPNEAHPNEDESDQAKPREAESNQAESDRAKSD
jgi:hypothetical protein